MTAALAGSPSGPAVVVDTVDQRAVLAAVRVATEGGRSCAVLDPTWPVALRDQARLALRALASMAPGVGSGRMAPESAPQVAPGATPSRVVPGAGAGRVVDAGPGGAVGAGLGAGHLVLFTSGSTGRPRGVLRTAASWQASADPLTAITGLSGRDVVWLPGPLWSSLFLYGAWHAAELGARLVLGDEDPTDTTAAHCVPAQLPGLLDRAAAGRLPALRLVVVAGDRLAEGLRRRCQRAGWRVVEYYGAAELSFVAWRDAPGDFRPFPGAEVALRSGTLWTRSPYLALGYAAGRSGPLRRDDEGWATVGDRASRGDGGGIELLGRGESAVTTGGHTVVVEEVEAVLSEVPEIRDAAVLGTTHPRLGQSLTALVVTELPVRSLRAAVAGLPAPARPRRWLRVPAVPRTAGGKIRRAELPALAAAVAPGTTDGADDRVTDTAGGPGVAGPA